VKKERKKNYRKAKGKAHISKEWDSNCFSSDSDDDGLAASAFDMSSLFPNERHTCLMAKEKKVHTRDTPKYTSSSDDESDDDVDYNDLFKSLDRSKVDKINELIDGLNEKDRLIEKQEDILYEEHDKLVNVEKYLALETKKNEILSSELSSCHESISSLWNMFLFAIDVKILMLMLAIIMFPLSLSQMMKLQTLMLNLKLAKLSAKK
jgi:hypothetical protein